MKLNDSEKDQSSFHRHNGSMLGRISGGLRTKVTRTEDAGGRAAPPYAWLLTSKVFKVQ